MILTKRIDVSVGLFALRSMRVDMLRLPYTCSSVYSSFGKTFSSSIGSSTYVANCNRVPLSSPPTLLAFLGTTLVQVIGPLEHSFIPVVYLHS